jgi:hypothetical protein
MDGGGLVYEQEPGKGGSPCESGTFKNGSMNATWEVHAMDIEGNQTGLSYDPSKEGASLFVADEYPYDATGAQGTQNQFKLKAGTALCESAEFAGELPGPRSALWLDATYSGGCSAFGFTGSIAMNGCSVGIDADDPYGGSIACPAGKKIEIVGKLFGTTKCTATISPKAGLHIQVEETGESEPPIRANLEVSGLAYHQQAGTGFGACKTTGDFEDGTYTGTILLG